MEHMLEHAEEALQFVGNMSRAQLTTDRTLELALTRLVEIIGEAASRDSESTRMQYPAIAWADAVGMRNRIVHVYYDVDLNVLWDTIIDDLPPLISQLRAALAERGR